MSTAGKVLVFLTVPLIIVWIILMSGVAHYNRQGTKAMQALEQQQAKIQAEIASVKLQIAALKDDLNIQQVETSRNLAVIQDVKYAVQKQVSDATDAQTGVTNALEEQQKALKAAELNRDHRIKERQLVEAELTKMEQEVESLKQLDTQHRNELKKLRDEFKKTYEQNKNRVKVVSQGQ